MNVLFQVLEKAERQEPSGATSHWLTLGVPDSLTNPKRYTSRIFLPATAEEYAQATLGEIFKLLPLGSQ